MQSNFLMGVKLWTCWGVAPTIFKIWILGWLFKKWSPTWRSWRVFLRPNFRVGSFFVPKNFLLDFFDNHGGRRSIAGTAQHSIKPILKEIPFNLTFLSKNWTYLQFYKRNTRKDYSKRKKNEPWNLVPKIPSRTVKLETIFEKNCHTLVILNILGATPQLVQNLTSLRKLLCTLLYQCCWNPRPPIQYILN